MKINKNRGGLFYMQQLEINTKFGLNKSKRIYIKYFLNIKKIYGLSALQSEILGLMATVEDSVITAPFGYSAENIALMLGYTNSRRRSVSTAMNEMANKDKWEEQNLPPLIFKATPKERSKRVHWKVNWSAIHDVEEQVMIQDQIITNQKARIKELEMQLQEQQGNTQLSFPISQNGGVRMAIRSGYITEKEVEHPGDLQNWNNFFSELLEYGYTTIFIKQELNRVTKAIKRQKLHINDKMAYFMKAIGQQELRIKKGTAERAAWSYGDEE